MRNYIVEPDKPPSEMTPIELNEWKIDCNKVRMKRYSEKKDTSRYNACKQQNEKLAREIEQLGGTVTEEKKREPSILDEDENEELDEGAPSALDGLELDDDVEDDEEENDIDEELEEDVVEEEDVIDDEFVDESDEMTCPKCGKEYKDEYWFEKHVESCDG